MSLNLTIDQGNTAAKMALWEGETLVGLAIEQTLTPGAVESFLAPYPPVAEAMYCSVASRGEEIVAALGNRIPRVTRLTARTPLPIAIDYRTPATLGTDRSAAAVGGWTLFPGSPLLVVDAGTAVTYDAVSADGRFLGGNIAPGMRMRLEALHRFTARLPHVEVPRDLAYDTFLGYDTPSAMILGAVYGIVGAISYYRAHLPASTKVVMTGGWAAELSKLVDFDVTVDPELVSKGLNRILLYNENN